MATSNQTDALGQINIEIKDEEVGREERRPRTVRNRAFSSGVTV